MTLRRADSLLPGDRFVVRDIMLHFVKYDEIKDGRMTFTAYLGNNNNEQYSLRVGTLVQLVPKCHLIELALNGIREIGTPFEVDVRTGYNVLAAIAAVECLGWTGEYDSTLNVLKIARKS